MMVVLKRNSAPALCKHSGTSSALGQMLFHFPVSPTYLRDVRGLYETPNQFWQHFSYSREHNYTLPPANFPLLITLLDHGHGTASSRAAHTTANGSYAAAARHGSCKTRDDAPTVPSNATPGTRSPSAERRPNIPAIHRKATITGSREP